MNTTEKYAEEILQGILEKIGSGTETPYQYRYLVEGFANYTLIEQDENRDNSILFYTSLKRYSTPKEIVIPNFSTLSKEEKKVQNILKKVQPEDLVKYGIIPEFIGRLPLITTIEELDINALKHSPYAISGFLSPNTKIIKSF